MPRAKKSRIKPKCKLYCCQCAKEVSPTLVTGKEIYPGRLDLHEKSFWRCVCQNYVGCHPGTFNALGCIANFEVRKIRMLIHDVIDHLLATTVMSRKEIYKQISKTLGKSFHTGEIRTVSEGEFILQILRRI